MAIYRFNKPIYLSNGKVIGNANPKSGPLGGAAFIDDESDQSELATKIREAAAETEKEKETAKAKKGAKAN